MTPYSNATNAIPAEVTPQNYSFQEADQDRDIELEFANPQVNLVDKIFTAAATNGLIHLCPDDSSLNGRTLTIHGKQVVNFSSCSYLGLEMDQRLRHAAKDAVDRYGTGFSMSRAYTSSPLLTIFENKLTELFNAYPIVTPSTTLGHLSFMPVFIQKGDTVLVDQFAHNSIQMSLALVAAHAKIVLCRHNDMDELEDHIKEALRSSPTNKIWYLADGIYSMTGGLAPLDKILDLLNKYHNLFAYMDDAHGMSHQGSRGRGSILGKMERIHPKLVVAVSLNKCFAMGTGGALVFPNKEWKRKFRTCGPTMIFSGQIPPAALGAGIASCDIHLSDEINDLQSELEERIELFRSLTTQKGIKAKDSSTPIQFVEVGKFEDAVEVAKAICNDGFYTNICAFPAVPRNKAGVRLTITRHQHKQDIHNLADSLERNINKILANRNRPMKFEVN